MSKPVKMFEKAAFGYRQEDVDNHIDELNRKIFALEEEKEQQASKMKILAERINEYRKEESDLKDALLGAQKMGNAIVSEAKTKADMTLTDAKSRSENMIYDAQKQAEEAIGSIKKQTEKEKLILAKMQKEVASFKANILEIYKMHLNVITNLPDMDPETEEFYNTKVEETKSEETASEEVLAEKSEIPEAELPEVSEEEADETNSTVRFDKVSPANPPYTPLKKPTFEEKFGELKFGKNNR